MKTELPMVGLLVTESLLRSPQQHPCGLGHYGLQFIRALSHSQAEHSNIRLLADNPGTRRECIKQLNLAAGANAPTWLDPDQWGTLDILHTFEPAASSWVHRRGRVPYRSLILSSTLSHWDPASVQACVFENFSAHDILFCASDAARQSVQRLWKIEIAKLQRRFGTLTKAPQLPKLMIASAGLPLTPPLISPADRIAARTTLRISPSDVVIIQAGHANAARGFDPTVLYRVVDEVRKRTAARLQIIDCCSFVDDAAKQAADMAARDLGLIIKRADLNKPEYLLRCLAAADLYAGLQVDLNVGFDNLHLQAMAAGIPSLLSNWGAHRHAVTSPNYGVLIDTVIPHRTALPAVVQGIPAPWCELVSIDFEQAVESLQLLSTDTNKRQNLGRQGQVHSLQVHGWNSVLNHYQICWKEQFNHRQRTNRSPRPSHSALSDVYRSFSTHVLDQHIGVYPQRGAGESSLKARINRFLADKAPRHATFPKEQQDALHKDNQRLLEWLDTRSATGGTAQAAALDLGRQPGQRLADLARLTRLGMARTEDQVVSTLHRPLMVVTGSAQRPNVVQQLTSDRRVKLTSLSGSLLDALQQAQTSSSHFLWLGPNSILHDYWIYERLQEAFKHHAIVLPSTVKPALLTQPDLQSLAWLAVRHDALSALLQNFSGKTPKGRSAKTNSWATLLSESQKNPSTGSVGNWSIDIAEQEAQA